MKSFAQRIVDAGREVDRLVDDAIAVFHDLQNARLVGSPDLCEVQKNYHRCCWLTNHAERELREFEAEVATIPGAPETYYEARPSVDRSLVVATAGARAGTGARAQSSARA